MVGDAVAVVVSRATRFQCVINAVAVVIRSSCQIDIVDIVYAVAVGIKTTDLCLYSVRNAIIV